MTQHNYPQIPKHVIDWIMDSNRTHVWFLIVCRLKNKFAAVWSITFLLVGNLVLRSDFAFAIKRSDVQCNLKQTEAECSITSLEFRKKYLSVAQYVLNYRC